MYGLNRAHGRGGPGHPVCDVSQDVSSSFHLHPIIRPVQERAANQLGNFRNKVTGAPILSKREPNWTMLSKQGTLTGFLVLISPPACNQTWATVQWNQTCCHDFASLPGIRIFQEDNQFTFHFYYLRNTSVHIVDGSAWPSQRWKGVQQWTKGQWQIRFLCGVTDLETLNIDTLVRDGMFVIKSGNKLEVHSPGWMSSGPFLHGHSESLPLTVIHTFNTV